MQVVERLGGAFARVRSGRTAGVANRSLGCQPVAEQRGVDLFAEPVTVRRVGIGLALIAALLTAGCAAGQQAQTAQQKPTLDGTYADLGPLKLRGIAIEAPSGASTAYSPGSAALMKLVIVNTGQRPDTLTSITSPAFSDWGSYASPTDASAVASAATASPTSGGLPSAQQSVVVVPGSRVSWGMPESTRALLLRDLTGKLYPAATVPVTFTFQNAGSVKVAVPVGLSLVPGSSVIPVPSTSSIEG
jgi:copper(I)-binding protein